MDTLFEKAEQVRSEVRQEQNQRQELNDSSPYMLKVWSDHFKKYGIAIFAQTIDEVIGEIIRLGDDPWYSKNDRSQSDYSIHLFKKNEGVWERLT